MAIGAPAGRLEGLGSMEVNAKLKELEEEFKVLKAEIRNVLLDIREVILDRTNPLGEEHESAHLTLDLNTTARAMATEAATHEAMKVEEEAEHLAGHDEAAAEIAMDGVAPSAESPEDLTAEQDAPAIVAAEAEQSEAPEEARAGDDEPPMPKVIRRNPTPAIECQPQEQLPTEIPRMYQANVPPISGTVSISSWLTEALQAVGPQELERIINIHRLWGNLPANISRALAYVQELLQTTEDTEPRWLKVMQELDRVAAL